MLQSEEQSRARMLTAHTCSNTCGNRLHTTSDGSYTSLSFPRFARRSDLYTFAHHRTRTCVHVPTSTGSILATASRQSKIGHVDHSRQHACTPRCDRRAKVRKWPTPAQHRSPTLSQSVRGRGHSPTAASRQSENQSCRPTTPRQSKISHVDQPRQPSLGVTGNPR